MTEKTILEDLMDRYDEAWSADPNVQKEAETVLVLQKQEQMLLLKQQQLLNQIELAKAESKFHISMVGSAVAKEAKRTDVIEETMTNVVSDVDELKQTVAELKANQVAQQPVVVVPHAPVKLGEKEQECKLNYDFKFTSCYKTFWNIDLFRKQAEDFLKNGEGKWYRYDKEAGTHHIIVDELCLYNEANDFPMCIAQTAAKDRPQWMKRKKKWRTPPYATLRIIPAWFFTGVTGIPVVTDPIDNLLAWREYHNFCIDNLERQGVASGTPLAKNIIRNWALNNASKYSISPNRIL